MTIAQLKTLIAIAMLVVGLYLIVLGNTWAPHTFEMLPDNEFGSWVELFVPFLPIVFIGLGAALYVSRRR
jgi:hypothetical protein